MSCPSYGSKRLLPGGMNAVPARSPDLRCHKGKVIAAATLVPHVVQTSDLLNAAPGPRLGCRSRHSITIGLYEDAASASRPRGRAQPWGLLLLVACARKLRCKSQRDPDGARRASTRNNRAPKRENGRSRAGADFLKKAIRSFQPHFSSSRGTARAIGRGLRW
jgi:hypothetical protein